jgi:polo-like kinase 1
MEKKEKVVPPSPPRVIRDETTGNAYRRVGFLGEVSRAQFCLRKR